MTMAMVITPSPFCTCAFASCCCLAVAEMVMATMMITMAMLRVRWWLCVHAGVQPGRQHTVHACTCIHRGGCMVGTWIW